MSVNTNRIMPIALCIGSLFIAMPFCGAATSGLQTQQAPSATRRIGAVKEITASTITLTPDSGSDVAVTIQPTTRIVRITPGEKDLKNAAPVQLQDIQIGDRILVGGKVSDDNQSFAASSIVVMKRSDLDARHVQDLQDWQKRGVDGLAKAVDVAGGTITIAVRGKDVVIHTSSQTVIRRYAPDSVKFDDAKSSTLQEIHSGDQVRARGDRSVEGSELAAAEIVSGTFPLFAGTVNSTDASSSTLSVHDLSSKRTVLVKVTQDSQLRHLPLEVAQTIAVRLKGMAGGASATATSEAASNSGSEKGQTKRAQAADPNSAAVEGGMAPGRNARGGRAGGSPDLQQLLSHAPSIALADLHKGDAVVILSTEGKAGSGTAITLFSGVEPILQAAPNAAQAMMLAPWNLSAPAGDLGGP
ncbi:MAG: hypothetical protein QOF94_493 [Acidobacteriaceae bacterium]